MKLKLYSILLILLLTSCYDVSKPEKPKDLLSQDEMVAILIDMAMMTSAKGINKKKLERSGIIPDEYIFKKHNIDSVRFNTSNNFYAYNVKEYEEIYRRVKDSLTVLRDHYKVIETKEKKEKAKRDSIRNVKRDSIIKAAENSKNPQLSDSIKAILIKEKQKQILIEQQYDEDDEDLEDYHLDEYNLGEENLDEEDLDEEDLDEEDLDEEELGN